MRSIYGSKISYARTASSGGAEGSSLPPLSPSLLRDGVMVTYGFCNAKLQVRFLLLHPTKENDMNVSNVNCFVLGLLAGLVLCDVIYFVTFFL